MTNTTNTTASTATSTVPASMTSIQAAIAYALGALFDHHWTRVVINNFERSAQLRRIDNIERLARRESIVSGDKPVFGPRMEGHKVVHSDDRVSWTIWPEGKVEFEVYTSAGVAKRHRIETQLGMLPDSDGYKKYIEATLDLEAVAKVEGRHTLLGIQIKPTGGIRATREPDHHGVRAPDVELANAMVLAVQQARG